MVDIDKLHDCNERSCFPMELFLWELLWEPLHSQLSYQLLLRERKEKLATSKILYIRTNT